MSILKKITKSKFAINVISYVAYWYIRLIKASTRWDLRGVETFYDNLEKYGSVIFVAWHGRAPMIPPFWDKRKKLKALVSPHRDGQLIAAILKKFGIGSIDGSTNENAKGAAVSIMKELKNGTTIAIIPDGPRGPSMTMSLSPVYYAQKAAIPVIGVTYSIKNSVIIEQSWDKMFVPKPFSKGICAVTEPFLIDKNASKEDLESYRLKIENALNNLTWQIDKELNMPYIPKGTLPKNKRKKVN
ncbi:MAG: DUF374 domain-containing protein [Alphaproteobacteria bacterium]|nr:DUF374 domain-containing protein [Alphaproteobacteria bacterium]